MNSNFCKVVLERVTDKIEEVDKMLTLHGLRCINNHNAHEAINFPCDIIKTSVPHSRPFGHATTLQELENFLNAYDSGTRHGVKVQDMLRP